jgi:hypothetical protein
LLIDEWDIVTSADVMLITRPGPKVTQYQTVHQRTLKPRLVISADVRPHYYNTDCCWISARNNGQLFRKVASFNLSRNEVLKNRFST